VPGCDHRHHGHSCRGRNDSGRPQPVSPAEAVVAALPTDVLASTVPRAGAYRILFQDGTRAQTDLASLSVLLVLALAVAIVVLAIRDSRHRARHPNYYLTRRALVVIPVEYLLGMLAIIFFPSLIWPHQPSSVELAIEVVTVVSLTIGLRLWSGRPRD
jgi:hypothetical protein